MYKTKFVNKNINSNLISLDFLFINLKVIKIEKQRKIIVEKKLNSE